MSARTHARNRRSRSRLAAGGTVALAVITSSDEGGKPKTETRLWRARRRSSSTSASGRSRGQGAPAGRAAPRGRAPPPPGGSSSVTTRPRRSARRSPSGRTRAWPPSSGWQKSGRATRSCSCISASRISGLGRQTGCCCLAKGRASAARLSLGAACRHRAPSRLPIRPAVLRAELPAATWAEAPRAAGPARGARGERPEQRCPREAPLRARSQRLGHRISARVMRRRRQARPSRRRGAGRSRSRTLRQKSSSRPSPASARSRGAFRRPRRCASTSASCSCGVNQPGSLDEAKRQLRLAQQEEPGSRLAREAKRLLAGLEGV